MYLELFEHIASHGVVVVGMDGKVESDSIDFQPQLANVSLLATFIILN